MSEQQVREEEFHGSICQSCGMPIERREQLGTSASGQRAADYCSYCYRDGHFTEPNLTKEGMISKVARALVTMRRMSEADAMALARHVVPDLKRWLDGG